MGPSETAMAARLVARLAECSAAHAVALPALPGPPPADADAPKRTR